MKHVFAVILFFIFLFSNYAHMAYADTNKKTSSEKETVIFTQHLPHGYIGCPLSIDMPPSGYTDCTTLHIAFNSLVPQAEISIYKDDMIVEHDVQSISTVSDKATYNLGQYGNGEYHVVIEFLDGSEYETWFTIE